MAPPLAEKPGGRETVPLHPICHRTLHVTFANAQLARIGQNAAALRADPAIARFLAWIARKPPDFHARTFAAR